MELLKKENDCALFLNADELHFVRTKTGNHTLAFVVGMIGGIFFVNGLIQLFMGNQTIAAILTPIGLAGLFFWRKLIMKRKNKVQEKPDVNNTLLIVDTCEKEFFSGRRIHYGNIEECRFSYSFQMTSSAKALVFKHPKGDISLAKGNPFGGSNKPFYKELRRFELV